MCGSWVTCHMHVDVVHAAPWCRRQHPCAGVVKRHHSSASSSAKLTTGKQRPHHACQSGSHAQLPSDLTKTATRHLQSLVAHAPLAFATIARCCIPANVHDELHLLLSHSPTTTRHVQSWPPTRTSPFCSASSTTSWIRPRLRSF
jgi:hypothetical protein